MQDFKIVIISGLSGSGKSTALNAFEDLGFRCIENLPGPLISPLIDLLESYANRDLQPEANIPPAPLPAEQPFSWALYKNIALLVDSRGGDVFPLVQSASNRLKKNGATVSLLFFDCMDEVLLNRFRETRRPHPLITDNVLDSSETNAASVLEALAKERELLLGIRQSADRIIDTSNFTPHDLRRMIEDYVGEDAPQEAQLEVSVHSFGFKYGVPNFGDLVVDVRFLPNPHFVPQLREKTGLDKEVADYVFNSADSKEFMEKYCDILNFLVPRYQVEGKRYLTIAVGCTGGKHRSVAIAAEIAQRLKSLDVKVRIQHRDIERL